MWFRVGIVMMGVVGFVFRLHVESFPWWVNKSAFQHRSLVCCRLVSPTSVYCYAPSESTVMTAHSITSSLGYYYFTRSTV